jgi:hypothetical protein
MSIEQVYKKKARELKKLDKRHKRMERRRLKRIHPAPVAHSYP